MPLSGESKLFLLFKRELECFWHFLSKCSFPLHWKLLFLHILYIEFYNGLVPLSFSAGYTLLNWALILTTRFFCFPEGRGSLYFYIKARGWATYLSVSVNRYSVADVFCMIIYLTDSGLEKVVSLFYQSFGRILTLKIPFPICEFVFHHGTTLV